MPIRLEQPVMLLLACLAAAVWLARLIPASRLRTRSLLSTGLFSLAILLAATALAGPVWQGAGRKDRTWLILQDVSASVTGQQVAIDLPDDQPRRVLRFARALAGPGQADPDPAATRIADGLQLARAEADRLAGVIIATDGQFQGDWLASARRLGRTELPGRTLPMQAPPADGRIAAATALDRKGDALTLQIALASNADQQRRLEIRDAAGQIIDSLDLQLLAQSPLRLRRRLKIPTDQAAVLTVSLAGPDASAGNDRASLRIEPTETRLLLAGPREQLDALGRLLQRPGRRILPLTIPLDEAVDLPAAGTVVLVDTTGQGLRPAHRQELARRVRSGAGLLVVGSGPRSSPDQRDDPLNQVLPLISQPYQRQPLSVTILLDASGSMGQLSVDPQSAQRVKFRLAADAVLSLRRLLTDRDRLEVVTFNEQAASLYRSDNAAIDFAALSAALAEVEPDGATDLAAGLGHLLAQPAGPPGRDQLVIVVTDLQVKPFQPEPAVRWFQAEAKRRLAVVAIAAGDDGQAQPTGLEQLARRTEAKMITRPGLSGLGKIFADLLSATRGDGVWQEPTEVRLVQPVWQIPAGTLPTLPASVPSALVDESEVLARAGWGPIFARRGAWLGRSVCLAAWSEAETLTALTEAEPWPQLLQRAVDWIQPPSDLPGLVVDLSLQQGRLQIDMTSPEQAEGDWTAELLTAADGPVARLGLRRTGLARWSGQMDLPGRDAHVVIFRNGQRVWSGSAYAGAGAELAKIGPDFRALQQLAEATGGQIVEPWRLAETIQPDRAQSGLALWPILAAAALGLILLDWLLARWIGRDLA